MFLQDTSASTKNQEIVLPHSHWHFNFKCCACRFIKKGIGLILLSADRPCTLCHCMGTWINSTSWVCFQATNVIKKEIIKEDIVAVAFIFWKWSSWPRFVNASVDDARVQCVRLRVCSGSRNTGVHAWPLTSLKAQMLRRGLCRSVGRRTEHWALKTSPWSTRGHGCSDGACDCVTNPKLTGVQHF